MGNPCLDPLLHFNAIDGAGTPAVAQAAQALVGREQVVPRKDISRTPLIS